jgi:hypothetical protein
VTVVRIDMAEKHPCMTAGCEQSADTLAILGIGDMPLQMNLCTDHSERLRFLLYALDQPPQRRRWFSWLRRERRIA